LGSLGCGLSTTKFAQMHPLVQRQTHGFLQFAEVFCDLASARLSTWNFVHRARADERVEPFECLEITVAPSGVPPRFGNSGRTDLPDLQPDRVCEPYGQPTARRLPPPWVPWLTRSSGSSSSCRN